MRKILSIAINTYRESVRSKILYSIMFFAVLLILISAFFGTVTIGDQVVVIKDFGLMSLSLFSVAFAVISGSALLNKELSRKTVYNILAKPVHRWEFLVGKYLGMVLTVGLMMILMGIGLSVFVFIFERKIDFLLLSSYYFALLELSVVCAAAIFFSSIVVTPILSGLFTFAIFLAGRSAEELLYFVNAGTISGALASFLKVLYVLLPHLDKVNVANEVVYGNSDIVGLSRCLWCTIYVLSYSGVLLVLASIIFKRREFN